MADPNGVPSEVLKAFEDAYTQAIEAGQQQPQAIQAAIAAVGKMGGPAAPQPGALPAVPVMPPKPQAPGMPGQMPMPQQMGQPQQRPPFPQHPNAMGGNLHTPQIMGQQQNKQQYSAEDMQTVDLENVELWSEGTFNGDKYTGEDLQAMVDAQAEIGGAVKPYVKLGHDNGQKLLQTDGYPAAGWITDLKKVGSKLYGTLKNVPRVIADLIEKKAYGRFSPEIAWNLKANGKTYKRVLMAAGLLGADTPANLTLKDFVNLYNDESLEIHSYHNLEGNKMPENREEESKRIAELELQVKNYAQKEFKSRVENIWKENSKKIAPVLEPIFKALCYADQTEIKSYSYAGHDGAEKTIEWKSAVDLVEQFAKMIPEIPGQRTVFADSKERRYTQEIGEDARKKGYTDENQDIIHEATRKYIAEVKKSSGKTISYKEAQAIIFAREQE